MSTFTQLGANNCSPAPLGSSTPGPDSELPLITGDERSKKDGWAPKESTGGKLDEIWWEGALRKDMGSGCETSRTEINKGKGAEGATRCISLQKIPNTYQIKGNIFIFS